MWYWSNIKGLFKIIIILVWIESSLCCNELNVVVIVVFDWDELFIVYENMIVR